MDKENDLGKLFSSYPSAEKDADIINIHIPSLDLKGKNRKYANANFMSYQAKLFLFDTDNVAFYTIYDYESSRAKLEDGIEMKDISIDLKDIKHESNSGVPLSDLRVCMENAVIMVGFIMYFYSHSHSSVFLNSKEFNPTAILGTWRVGDG